MRTGTSCGKVAENMSRFTDPIGVTSLRRCRAIAGVVREVIIERDTRRSST
jgi:hypothetical protein